MSISTRQNRLCSRRCDVTLRLWLVLKPRLASAAGLTRVYERLERPLVPVLAHMEERGITIERRFSRAFPANWPKKAASFEDEIYELAGERFNIGSPKQLGDILFGKMNLPGGSRQRDWPMVYLRTGS